MVIGKISKIGIALAAYEPNISFLSEQLRSIQAQSFSNWVCVVTFDSPMEKVINEPSIKHFTLDARFIFSENPVRLGHKKNFERALNEVVKYEVDAVACSDQDDIWYPEKLDVCAQYLSMCPPMSLVHSDMHVLKDGNKLANTAWNIERRGVENAEQHHLLVRNVVAGCSMLMDSIIIKQFPEIPAEVEYHDHWYSLIAASLGRVRPIHQALYSYRQHNDNVVAVSPFRGVFYIKKNTGVLAIFSKARVGFLRSRQLAEAGLTHRLAITPKSTLLFRNKLDFGVSLLCLGFYSVLSDPPLSRAMMIRGFGKFVETLLACARSLKSPA